MKQAMGCVFLAAPMNREMRDCFEQTNSITLYSSRLESVVGSGGGDNDGKVVLAMVSRVWGPIAEEKQRELSSDNGPTWTWPISRPSWSCSTTHS